MYHVLLLGNFINYDNNNACILYMYLKQETKNHFHRSSIWLLDFIIIFITDRIENTIIKFCDFILWIHLCTTAALVYWAHSISKLILIVILLNQNSKHSTRNHIKFFQSLLLYTCICLFENFVRIRPIPYKAQ